MNTRIRMARLLSVAAIVIGICVATGQPVWAHECDLDYVTQVGNTFIVDPTGGDDTANLECAFDAAAAAGPGSTVQLMDGTYSIGMIAVNEFHGSFVGSGKEQTTITTVSPLDCSGGWPELIAFRKGIHVADMTFDISDPHPCQPWEHAFMGTRDDLAVIVTVVGQPIGWASPDYDWSIPSTVYANSSFENVAFRGANRDDPAIPWSVSAPLAISGGVDISPDGIGRFRPLRGVHTVANCSFENAVFGIAAYGLESASVLVGGSGSTGNTFADVSIGLWGLDNSNSSIEFSHNEVVDVAPYGTGVLAVQDAGPLVSSYPWPSPSQYLIRYNTLDVAGPVDAISIMDFGPAFGEGSKIHAVVSQNRIHLEDGEWGGVWGLGAQDVLVTNNRITGSGMAGIYFGFQGLPSSGWTIIGNSVQNLESDVAAIWLGEDTSLCTVVGGSNKTNVLDEGTDNIIAGVNTTGGNPPGPEIREAMQRKLEILSHFP